MTEEGFCVLVGALFAALFITVAVVFFRTEAACLGFGYPGYGVTWDLARYCHRRENGYDVVVRLVDLNAGRVR